MASRLLNILHLSDIQFGEGVKAGAKQSIMLRQATNLAKSILEDLGQIWDLYGVRPNAIAITGDIAQQSTHHEYAPGIRLVRSISSKLGISSDSVYVIPGNHDISWAISKRIFSGHHGVPKVSASNHKKLIARFSKFVEALKVNTSKPSGEPCVVLNPNPKSLFLLFDTSIRESHLRKSHYGFVEDAHIQDAILQADTIDPKRKLLRIALCHHNPITKPTLDDSLRNGMPFLTALAEGGISVLLHGHIHLSEAFGIAKLGAREIAVCSTGRVTQGEDEDPLWTPRYQLVLLDIGEGGSSFVLPRKYDDTCSPPKWVPDNVAASNERGLIRFSALPQGFEGRRIYPTASIPSLEALSLINKQGHAVLAESGIVEVISTFDNIPFDQLFLSGWKDIQIINTYGGSWLGSKLPILRETLTRCRTTITVCMTDPKSISARAAAERIDQSRQKFKSKVESSVRKLQGIYEKINNPKGRLRIYFTQREVLYTVYRFDSVVFYAPLQLSSDWPTSPLPALRLDLKHCRKGMAEFVRLDTQRLLSNDSILVWDSE